MGKNSGYQVPEDLELNEAGDALVTEIDLAGVEDLAAAEQTVVTEADELAALEDPSDDQLNRLDALVLLAERIREEGASRNEAVEARRERARKAKERLAGPADEGDGQEGEGGDGDGDEGTGSEGDGDGDEGQQGAEGDAGTEGAEGEGDAGAEGAEGDAPQAVAAGGRTPARRSPAPSLIRGRSNDRPRQRQAREQHAEEGERRMTITASSGIRGVEAGSELGDFDALVAAFQQRAASHPGRPIPDQYLRHPVASLSRGKASFNGLVDTEFSSDLELLDAAADEKRLPGGSLAAAALTAAGWCAPSETLYDFVALETTDGLFDNPEVMVNRGGLNLTTGPDFSDIFANSGFTQTEAQNIAGDTKACYTVPCPDFEETRLDAIGFCIKNGFLTNTAYPELVRRVLSGALVAHQAKKSAKAVNAVASELGTSVVLGDAGSTARNILTGLELAAEGLRNQFHMGVNATMEVVLPHWVRAALRDDLQSRLRDPIAPVTDEQLDAHFAARKLRVQFIYGFGDTNVVAPQAGNTLVIAFPATIPALIYPAGTFITGVADVINLDTVYDSTDLEVNVYTAAFVEEAMLVARRAPGGGRLTIPTNNSGAVGPVTLPAWAEQV